MLFCKFRYTSFYVIITDNYTILIIENFSFLRWRAINTDEVSNFVRSDVNGNIIKILFSKFLIIIDKREILFIYQISSIHSVEMEKKISIPIMKRCKMTRKKTKRERKKNSISNLIIIDIVSHSFFKASDKFIDKLTIIHLTALPLWKVRDLRENCQLLYSL